MVSLVGANGRVDVHDYPRRMERARRHLENNHGISDGNRRKLLAYVDYLEDEDSARQDV